MATMGQRIKELRKSLGMTQFSLAEAIGVSKSAIGMYETDKREPDNETLECIADYFNVDIDYLYGKSDIRNKYEWWKTYSSKIDPYTDIQFPSNILPLPTMRKIPLIGTIACGTPILATENLGEDVFLPDHIRNADFALRCKGDSMINAGIQDGDIVYIRQQDMVDDGQIAAVVIEDEATLKRVYYNRPANTITLVAENPSVPSLIYHGETLNHIRIIGKAVGYTHSLEA